MYLCIHNCTKLCSFRHRYRVVVTSIHSCIAATKKVNNFLCRMWGTFFFFFRSHKKTIWHKLRQPNTVRNVCNVYSYHYTRMPCGKRLLPIAYNYHTWYIESLQYNSKMFARFFFLLKHRALFIQRHRWNDDRKFFYIKIKIDLVFTVFGSCHWTKSLYNTHHTYTHNHNAQFIRCCRYSISFISAKLAANRLYKHWYEQCLKV